MKRTRKIPMRMCIGCREMKPKKELKRIVRTTERDIIVDPTGKKSGRGAYVCPNPNCVDNAIKAEELSRALATKVSSQTALKIKEDISRI